MVLGDLKKTAEDYLGEKVDRAVITVPAYFKRLTAYRDQGSRRDRRPEGRAHHQ